uniref:hypothetical protein n=1 Tax=Paractinoplanes polyasparticus TaxID=2856853 RepID=UPI001C845127|nr:hypothetical protein [Actinoplanes polyasparticus]
MTWQMQLQVTVERPIDQPFGQPGEVWSTVETAVHGPRGLRWKSNAFTAKSWDAFLGRLATVPHHAALSLITLDRQGFPNAFPTFSVALDTNDDDHGWLFLKVRFGPELLDDRDFQKSTLAFARSFAEATDLAYAEISYDRGSGRTAYEDVFRGRPGRTALTSRETLRGYAWLTVCPREIGERLGGLDTFRGSGAFAEAERLPAGGYWLLATEDWRDFGPAAAERIFPVLAPALRPGPPMQDVPDDPPYYVSRRNAAELQG